MARDRAVSQILLALMPLLIWAFLMAYEKCYLRSGALLGLVGAGRAILISNVEDWPARPQDRPAR